MISGADLKASDLNGKSDPYLSFHSYPPCVFTENEAKPPKCTYVSASLSPVYVTHLFLHHNTTWQLNYDATLKCLGLQDASFKASVNHLPVSNATPQHKPTRDLLNTTTACRNFQG